MIFGHAHPDVYAGLVVLHLLYNVAERTSNAFACWRMKVRL